MLASKQRPRLTVGCPSQTLSNRKSASESPPRPSSTSRTTSGSSGCAASRTAPLLAPVLPLPCSGVPPPPLPRRPHPPQYPRRLFHTTPAPPAPGHLRRQYPRDELPLPHPEAAPNPTGEGDHRALLPPEPQPPTRLIHPTRQPPPTPPQPTIFPPTPRLSSSRTRTTSTSASSVPSTSASSGNRWRCTSIWR